MLRAILPARAWGLIRGGAEAHPTRWSGKHDGGHVETGMGSKTLSNSGGLRGGSVKEAAHLPELGVAALDPLGFAEGAKLGKIRLDRLLQGFRRLEGGPVVAPGGLG